MATKKVSAMTAATALTGAELVPIVQGGANKSSTVSLFLEETDEFLQGIRALGSVALGRTLSLGPPSSSITLVDGRQQMVAVWLKKSATLTGVKFIQMTQGNYTADNNNRIGLYTQLAGSLTLVASCANDGNLWKGAPGIITVPFTVPYAATRGVYYVAYLYNQSAVVTAPVIAGTPQISVNCHVLDMTNSNSLSSYKASADLLPTATLMSAMDGPNYIPGFFMLY